MFFADPENYDYFTDEYMDEKGIERWKKTRRLFSGSNEYDENKSEITVDLSYVNFYIRQD